MSTTPDNPYNKRYRSASIHEDLRYSAERLVAAKTDNLEANYLFKHARVGRGIAHLRTLLDAADPELMNLAQIDNMNGIANKLRTHCDAYANGKNQGALDNADNTLNELYNYIRFLPITTQDRATSAANEAIRDFTKSAVGFIEDIHKRTKSLAESIEAHAQRIQDQRAKIDETNRTIESQKARLDQAIATHQTTFSKTEADRAKQFLEQSASWEKSRQELLSLERENAAKRSAEFTENTKQSLEDFRKKASGVLATMESLERDTKRIFGVVGTTSQSGEYKNTADREKKSADWLRIVALLLMGAMIAVGALAFKHSLDHPEVDWKLFAFRLGTTIILAIPAVYAAQESEKHRRREHSNRRIHLELAAIDAYLELLPEDKRHEIKASLTNRFFGREEPAVSHESPKDNSHAVLKILEEAVKNLTKPHR